MKKTIFILIFLAILFFIITVAAFAYFVWNIALPLNPDSTEEIVVSIEKGEGAQAISEKLEQKGIIKSKYLFLFSALLKGAVKNLQAGDYLFSSSMPLERIIEKISKGDVIKETITIIEGWNLKDIAFYFEEKKICSAQELLSIAEKDFSRRFDFLEDKPRELNLEGYFFPDTYEILPGNTTEDIVLKILENFGAKLLPEIREEISRQEKTIFEIITMASLIEKEVRTLEDKKIVSGILWKRLDVEMPLQVDATIAYLTGKKTTRVSLEELKIDSPYNTYKYRGLPLGPISNPGIESITAAAHPEKTDFWFYLSKPDGTTVFSRNLDEHNAAKNKYLR